MSGMSEEDYTAVTYDNTIAVATVLKEVNPGLFFALYQGAIQMQQRKARQCGQG
jgi:hypothetical protein